MPGPKIRTLLIDDSGFMRIFLSDLLRRDQRIEIAATASNGHDGVEKAKSLRPDVVITDMVMPQYDGLYVVQQLMRDMPVPIILLSSLDRTDPKIFDALKEGAFDFLDKPQRSDAAQGYHPLTNMINEASAVDYQKLRGKREQKNIHAHTFEADINYDVVVIGASTGGPGAVETIVNKLPCNLTVPVIVAQHMPERFIESFATRLASATGLHVSVARDEEEVRMDRIYLVPGSANTRLVRSDSKVIMKFTYDRYREFNHPSIDCLFESAATVYGRRAIGVVLTGMGKDGTKGLQKMKAAGGLTIAQDESTSVVFGMPKSAFECGAASHLIPVNEISNFIVSAL